MAGTFLDMVNRVTTELRRSNTPDAIKLAINDAVDEAATDRFYFNEMHLTFPTVVGQEYYPDLGLVGIDALWYLNGASRYDVDLASQNTLDGLAQGNVTNGPLLAISHYGGTLRLYPVPNAIYTVHADGYGKLTPFPLVNDADTSAWLTDGELYIRALAKRNFLRDVVRDYGEARVYDTIAEDYKLKLVERSAIKSSTGTIRSTQF